MVNETNQPYAYAGDDPVNGVDPSGLWSWNPISDATEAWNDTGGKVVSFTSQHWRGIVTVVAIAGGAVAVIATGGAAIFLEGSIATAVLETADLGIDAVTLANGALCFTTRGSGEVIACAAALTGGASRYVTELGLNAVSFWSQGQYLWKVGLGGASVVTGWAASVGASVVTGRATSVSTEEVCRN
jgi:hypothetical protein